MVVLTVAFAVVFANVVLDGAEVAKAPSGNGGNGGRKGSVPGTCNGAKLNGSSGGRSVTTGNAGALLIILFPLESV